MNRLHWEITDAGRSALAAVSRPEALPGSGRVPRLDIEITPAGTGYLAEHRAERVSPALRAILANPAGRSA